MDAEDARQEWDKLQQAQWYKTVRECGTYSSDDVARISLNYVPLHLWNELSAQKEQPPSCDARGRIGKIIDMIGQAFHAAWYWSVWLYYFALYFLLFLGPGCEEDLDSWNESASDEGAEPPGER